MLSNSSTKVVEVALSRLARHWDADEIHRRHPDSTLARIRSVFAHYYGPERNSIKYGPGRNSIKSSISNCAWWTALKLAAESRANAANSTTPDSRLEH